MAMIPNVNAAASNAAITQSKIVGKPFFRDMTLQRSPANGGAEFGDTDADVNDER
jgi:hypothetical protein